MIAYGFHAPWFDGCMVTLRRLLAAISPFAEVLVVTIAKNDSMSDIGNVYYIRAPRIFQDIRVRKDTFVLVDELADVVRVIRLVVLLCRREGIDILHIHNVSRQGFYAVMLRSIMNLPLLIHVYTEKDIHSSSIRVRFNTLLDCMTLNKAKPDGYVCTSSYLAGSMRALGFPSDRVSVVPPPVDCNRFKPADQQRLRGSYGINSDEFVVAYIGRATPSRGVSCLVRAVAKVVNESQIPVKLLLCPPQVPAEDKHFKEILRLVKQSRLGGSTIILGKSEKVEELYNLADLVAIPFTKMAAVDPPLTLLESMACGTPVVGSALGGIPDVIRDGESGFLVKPGDVSELAVTIGRLARAGGASKEIRKKARETILKHYSAAISSKMLVDLYQKMVT